MVFAIDVIFKRTQKHYLDGIKKKNSQSSRREENPLCVCIWIMIEKVLLFFSNLLGFSASLNQSKEHMLNDFQLRFASLF